MKALISFFPLFRQRGRALALALFLSLVTLLAGVALLGTSGWFITAAALTTLGVGFNLFVPSSLVRGFSFIRILARYGERLVGHDATLRLLSNLRGWLFARLFPRLPLPDRSLRHGDLVSRLTADVDALDNAFLVAIGPWLSAIVVGTVMTTVLATLLPDAALAYGAAMACAALAVPAGLLWLSRGLGRASVEANADLRMAALDGALGHADLTALGALGSASRRFEDASARAGQLRRQLGGLTSAGAALVQVLAALALIGVLWAGLLALDAGRIEGPVLAGLLLAVLGSFEATGMIVRGVGKAGAAMAAAERLVALAELPPPVAEPDAPLAVPHDASIRFDRVSFAYPGAPPVLAGLSMTIRPGQKIAITGPSGCGKSTLLRLLLRLAEPQQGTVALGGQSLARYCSADLHAHMALLSQDSPIFLDTLRNNLLLGRADADDAALRSALQSAQLDGFVATLPQGLDSRIGEAGRSLSAGQGRRLCLARALLSQAPILLLDEPTAALDRETELAFFRILAEAAADRTIIMVTHADIPGGTVDRVLTLRNGQIQDA
ncbi:thiol reductant ABC exporter subunit CydC [Devosia chinhatensis]|uniref:ABC transporter ATP-binding protein n=1 Tax=Devosia chinhatensis TaxID=429727 RepID=A0A0F5FK92_9HYPH|nr:thiol reductant ABC exporter subunit CydC [Devosia chinhatensis]KKB08995.1 ABC transporter ATP-binding protein [Devosia chinhatensis]